jgi:hypothetical protein
VSTGAFGGEHCQKCDVVRIVEVEHVEGRGPGWKCHACGWWNWLKPVRADDQATA